MGIAGAVIGIGLSAASTINQMNAQKEERDRQNAIIDSNLLELEDRLTLAKMHTEATKAGATLLRDREKGIIDAQRVQSNLQIQEQSLQQELAQTQARLQAKGIEAQAQMGAAQLLGNAQNESAEVLLGASNELEQAKSVKTPTSSTTGSKTSVANQARQNDALTTLQNRLGLNADISKTLAQKNLEYAKQIGQGQLGLAGVQSGYIRDTAQIQSEMDAQFKPFATRQTNLTARRNQLASKGAMETRQASADMNLLGQSMQTMYGRNSLEAQRPSGGGGMLNGVLGMAQQGIGVASQLGLFSGASNAQPQMPVGTFFGSQRLGVYSGTPNTVDNVVGMAGTSKTSNFKFGMY